MSDSLYDAFFNASSIAELEPLLKAGNCEALNIEWKSSTSELTSAMQTICAFLNHKGGIALLGIKDNGKIIGQEVADKTKREIAYELGKFEPYPHIQVTYIPVSESKWIIKLIAIPEHKAIPYAYDGRAYTRHESSTCRMSQIRYEELLQQRFARAYPWDKQPAKGVSLEDLDHALIRRVWQDGIRKGRVDVVLDSDDPLAILKRLKLLTDGKTLNNAAVVLFCSDMPNHYLNCELKLAAFNSLKKDVIIDSRIVNSNIFELLREAQTFIHRNTPISSYIPKNQFERIDQPAYAYDALREAVLNALCHRDYTALGSASVMFYKDRLEITSSGSLPPGLTVDALATNEESFPRNESIASVLYFCGEIEKFGSGMKKIIKLCREMGAQPPIFEERHRVFSVTFTPLEPIALLKARERAQSTQDAALSTRQKEILALIKEHQGISMRGLLEHFHSLGKTTVYRELATLEEAKLIYKEGKARNTIWQAFL